MGRCKTLDQARAVVTFLDAASEKTLRSTVALTAARGRGKVQKGQNYLGHCALPPFHVATVGARDHKGSYTDMFDHTLLVHAVCTGA